MLLSGGVGFGYRVMGLVRPHMGVGAWVVHGVMVKGRRGCAWVVLHGVVGWWGVFVHPMTSES